MPLYDYECQLCKHVQERIEHMNDESAKTCAKCEGPSVRIITTSFFAQGDLEDYVEYNLGEQPVRITSRAQRRKLMRKADVYESYGKGWV